MNQGRLVLMVVFALGLSTLGCKKKPPTGPGGTATPTPGATATPQPTANPNNPYPHLPSSCQTLPNRTHGTCQDLWNSDQFPLGWNGYEWEYVDEVREAIANVPRDPSIFVEDRVRPEKRADYARQLGDYLNRKGICAAWDGDTFYVRSTRVADYNENFNIFTGGNNPGRPQTVGHYKCEPANDMPGTMPGYSCNVSFDESRPLTCRLSSRIYHAELMQVVQEIINEELPKGAASKIIDTQRKSNHERGYRVKDDGYPFMDQLAKKLMQKGFCIKTTNRSTMIEISKQANLFERYFMVHGDPFSELTAPRWAGWIAACQADGIDQRCETIIERADETCEYK